MGVGGTNANLKQAISGKTVFFIFSRFTFAKNFIEIIVKQILHYFFQNISMQKHLRVRVDSNFILLLC